MARVFVAMSGGVDSSVAAALLLEQGHEITGVTMQLWPSSDDAGGCCSVSAVRDARRVCDLLGVPHYSFNYRDVFEREVVAPFAEEYAAGRTPNPCITCNDRLKFSDLLAKVALQGADFLATGHYAQLQRDDSGTVRLARGLDPGKDQSYFLYRLTPQQMKRVLFPVGGLHKTQVRAIAEQFGLPVADKAESQEACFAQDGDYARVVCARHPEATVGGDIVDVAGRVRGRHNGLVHYTVGQRKGLGIGGPEGPLFVVRLDIAKNRVVVGRREDLRVGAVTASDVVWEGVAPQSERLLAVVRYRMAPAPARATVAADGLLHVTFDERIEGVAPGQSVVCYRGDVVAGGGVIQCAN